MARIETDPNYTSPTFSRATAATDAFKKEDVQLVAAALSTHDHTTGKGLPMAAGSIPNGTITSAMIADATIDTADLKDGSVTSAKIADGTIATADLANASVTNAKLAADTARDNLLTNGGFEIWQRGNGPFTTGVFGPDRWALQVIGTDTLAVARAGAGAVDAGSQYAASCTFTLGSGAGSTAIYQQNKLTDYSVAGKTLTVSARVATGTAGAVRLRINSDGTGSPQSNSPFTSGLGGYETLTASITVPLNATNFTVALYFAASCSAYIDNVMLVVGSQYADYAPLHPADDLARCLRYYEQTPASGNWVLTSYGGVSQAVYIWVPLLVKKAVLPTVTKVGTFSVANCGQPTVYGYDNVGFTPMVTATAAGQVFLQGSAAAYFTIEANP